MKNVGMNVTMLSLTGFLIAILVLYGDDTVDEARVDLVDHQAVVREGLQAGGPPVGQRPVLISDHFLVGRKGLPSRCFILRCAFGTH